MSLENFYEPFLMQDWTSKPDGFGGIIWGWQDGAPFQAGLILDSSIEARVADAQGVHSVYTIMTIPNLNLEFQDVIRRVKDGALYRITGTPTDDMPPELADVQFKRVSAEKVEKR